MWHSRVAQRERAGPITQRSMDRNHPLLVAFGASFFSAVSCKLDKGCLKTFPKKKPFFLGGFVQLRFRSFLFFFLGGGGGGRLGSYNGVFNTSLLDWVLVRLRVRERESLCGLQQGSSSSIPPLLDQSKGSYVSEVIDKTELFNDVFINQNATLNESSFPIGPTPVASTFNLDAVTPEEVKNGLKSLPSKTSVGEDGISYRLLQEVGPGVVGPLVSLFNKSISLGSVPTEWKMAVVTLIFKGGRKDRRIPANYRPISLTSCVARLLEKIINKKLLGYLTKHNLIFEHQSGFLTGHSTETQLCYLIHRWQMALDKNQMVHAAFLDLSKAYDRVSIPALLHKLSCVGLSKNTLSWFTAFLQSRKQCVQIDGQKSSWQVTKSGIPQGTVLGPTLFLIYINDFPSCIDNDVSIFADDTTVYTIGLPINQNATAISLTADLNNADLWARIWGMLFNADKSEI